MGTDLMPCCARCRHWVPVTKRDHGWCHHISSKPQTLPDDFCQSFVPPDVKPGG
jgi:hypothetical protein